MHVARGKAIITAEFGIDASDLPPIESGRVDPRRWFPEPDRPLEIEIGPGKGTFLVQAAGGRESVNFLGIESAAEFFRYAADRMRRRRLENVRVLRADATEFIRFWCADEVAEVVHLYFSDPWPKQRHHKRRVIQDRTLQEIHRVLRPGGELRLVTDHDDLQAWYEEHARRAADRFEQCPFPLEARSGDGEWVGTNYERKFALEGRPIHAMILRRRPP
jgi:tRNA (guanine-N7-)-methyltransferase